MADLSAITIPVAALGPLLSALHSLVERRKRTTLEARVDDLERKNVELERQVKECEEERTRLKRARRRKRTPRHSP